MPVLRGIQHLQPLNGACQWVNYCGPGLVPHLSSALARGPGRVPATCPCPAVLVPALSFLAPAAHAVQPLAAASAPSLPELGAASAPSLAGIAAAPAPPGLAGEGRFERGLIAECFHHPAALAASVGQPEHPAWGALDAEYPAAESAGGLLRHAADSGSSCCAASAVVPPGEDTDRRYTAADRQAAGRAPEQSRGSTGPIPCDAAPIRGPNADPSGAAHWIASRESTQEAAGSSALGHAK